MARVSRRTFIATSIVGAGAAAAAAAVPSFGFLESPSDARGPQLSNSSVDPSAPLVAFIRDARRGEISVLVGEDEIVVSDPHLAAHLAGTVRNA